MLELTLPTMTCGHCVKTVTETVQRLDPDAELEIDLPSHHARIRSAQPDQAIRDALSKQGYAPA